MKLMYFVLLLFVVVGCTDDQGMGHGNKDQGIMPKAECDEMNRKLAAGEITLDEAVAIKNKRRGCLIRTVTGPISDNPAK